MQNLKIGWIGLGKMGIPMAEQLINAGYALSVYNRSKDKEASLKAMGAEVVSTPAALLAACDMVFLMVSDDEAIKQIFSAENGLLADESIEKIIINMSTVSPGISKEMAALCQSKGNAYLDAPVSGSVKQAETGTLVIMVGGAADTFEKVKPVFEKLGKLSMRLGDSGAGNTAKLAINSLLALQAQGLAETVLFAEANQINTEDLITLIGNSAIGNIFGKIKGDAIVADNYSAAFALKHIAKDLRLAKAEGLSGPLADAAFATFQSAENEYGDEDIIAVLKALKGK